MIKPLNSKMLPHGQYCANLYGEICTLEAQNHTLSYIRLSPTTCQLFPLHLQGQVNILPQPRCQKLKIKLRLGETLHIHQEQQIFKHFFLFLFWTLYVSVIYDMLKTKSSQWEWEG